MSRIFVTAAEGKVVPLHSSDAAGPGASTLMLQPGVVVEVERSGNIVRRIAAGDLVEVAAPAVVTPPVAKKD